MFECRFAHLLGGHGAGFGASGRGSGRGGSVMVLTDFIRFWV